MVRMSLPPTTTVPSSSSYGSCLKVSFSSTSNDCRVTIWVVGPASENSALATDPSNCSTLQDTPFFVCWQSFLASSVQTPKSGCVPGAGVGTGAGSAVGGVGVVVGPAGAGILRLSTSTGVGRDGPSPHPTTKRQLKASHVKIFVRFAGLSYTLPVKTVSGINVY